MNNDNPTLAQGAAQAEAWRKLAHGFDAQRMLFRDVLKAVRDRFFPADQPERDRDEMWGMVNEALASSPQSAATQPAVAVEAVPATFWIKDQGPHFPQNYTWSVDTAADWRARGFKVIAMARVPG